MNAAHLHLILNHAPVVGTALALGVLGYGLARKSEELKRTALGLLVLLALVAIPVYLTGEPAEELVESLSGVSHAFLGRHEQAAGVAFTGSEILGVAALAGLIGFRRGRLLPGWYGLALVGAALTVGGLMAWTANLGGQIRHSEIRSVPSRAEP